MTTIFHSEQTIRELEDRRYGAMVSKDFDLLDTLLDENVMYTHSSGVIDTKSSYMDGIRSGVWDYQRVIRTGFEGAEPLVRIVGDTALVFAKLSIEQITRGEHIAFTTRALAVWVRQAGQWRLQAVQSSAIK
jgi:ketosteroid isomerase-like protein